MTLELVTIPCLKDNYAYLVHDAATGATAVIDVPETAAVLAELRRRGWQLTDLISTPNGAVDVDDCQALVWRTSVLLDPLPDSDGLPPRPRRCRPGRALDRARRSRSRSGRDNGGQPDRRGRTEPGLHFRSHRTPGDDAA